MIFSKIFSPIFFSKAFGLQSDEGTFSIDAMSEMEYYELSRIGLKERGTLVEHDVGGPPRRRHQRDLKRSAHNGITLRRPRNVVMRGGVDLLSRFFIIFFHFLLSARCPDLCRSKTARSVCLHCYLVHIKLHFRLTIPLACPLFCCAGMLLFHSRWRLLRFAIISAPLRCSNALMMLLLIAAGRSVAEPWLEMRYVEIWRMSLRSQSDALDLIETCARSSFSDDSSSRFGFSL
jgi:hypothetical protein